MWLSINAWWQSSANHEKKIQDLKSQLFASEADKNLALNKIKNAFEKERDSLTYLLEKTKENNEYDKKIAVSNAITELKDENQTKDTLLDEVMDRRHWLNFYY